ncbi:hypothetical protein AB1N83_013690 [Pleurotus pulmonarius]
MRSFQLLALCLYLLGVAAAAMINVTHDSSDDYSISSSMTFTGPWSHQQVATCTQETCADPFSRTTNGTWSTSLYVQNSPLADQPPTVSFEFLGTAVYVNCVLIPQDKLGIAANSDMLFTLDGVAVGRFAPEAPKSGEISISTVFKVEDLSAETHTLHIQNGLESGKATHKISVLALDSIIYTTNDALIEDTMSPEGFRVLASDEPQNTVHVALTSVMSSLVGLGILLLSFRFCYRRRQKMVQTLLPLLPTAIRRRQALPTVTPYTKALDTFGPTQESSLRSVRSQRRSDNSGNDDARSGRSVVPPPYSRSYTS